MNSLSQSATVGTGKLGFNTVGYHGGASPTEWFMAQQLMQGMMQHAKQFNEVPERSLYASGSSPRMHEVPPVWNSGFSELHVAASNGQQLTTRHLLESNQDMAEINQQDRHGNTPLHWAASEAHGEIVKALLENGADANLQNVSGETPLILATARNSAEAVVSLLQAGANPNLGNIEEATPLHFAASHGHLEVLKLLLQYGAFVHAQDEEGDSILHYAVREGQADIVSFLARQYPSLMQVKNEDNETAYDLAVSVQDSGMVNILQAFTH